MNKKQAEAMYLSIERLIKTNEDGTSKNIERLAAQRKLTKGKHRARSTSYRA